MRTFSILIALIFLGKSGNSQSRDSSVVNCYDSAYNRFNELLLKDGAFKEAVFTSENAYFNNQLNQEKFYNYITALKNLCLYWSSFNAIRDYKYADSVNFQKNFGLYAVMKDTIKIIDTALNKYYHLPFTYDFNDFAGRDNWANMFVSKLLITHKGNCHSLPYLYKILADEIGASCWLALAPNHMYIENRCKKTGWYNTELTSGEFPIDAWIMASGYLPLQAVQTGIYMDTLSNQESIAMCILDLAKGYEHKTNNYYDGFILKCCDLSLHYFPHNVQAILLKAETLKHIYEKQKVAKLTTAKNTYHQMEELYVRLFDLGYREMPDKMYQQWLQSVVKEQDKYSNKQLRETVHGKE
jgi:hypothetical protein